MKKFRFSLDTVLDYRQQVQDSLQVELSAITAEVHRQEGAVNTAQQRFMEINQEYREKKAAGLRIADIRGYETALEVQTAVIARELLQLQKLQKQMESKRQELVSAKQDASSVEKLREKKLRAYRKDLEKSEEQFIDDLVGARSANAQGASL
ncbi:Flagellar FliJ protein [anaerobic digester metagenome]|jgi:flagellar FliJ protein|uniref:flagellar export protein FliJ n=1 Tax=Oscillibacter ruminantium TaxID=1263547 RepID=UPI002B2016DF|nr:flagellar export protein FliJ [Oscillibacter ruminantium]MEA5041261.1 flagellar export protein FliJ [Oscillibacter ruminantium]